MAIPRLAEGKEAVHSARSHRRHVSRACESCRQRKTKCTGDKSGCRNCRDAGIICCYTDGKREKSKRQMASLETKINAYEDILQRLSVRFGVSEEQLMGYALAVPLLSPFQEDPSDYASSHGDASPPHPETRRQSSVSEVATPLFSGFSNNLDHIEEDFNRDEISQATGFVGQSSEISWLQTLAKELDHECDPSHFSGKEPSPAVATHRHRWISFPNYHLDDMEIPMVEHVDLYAYPSKDVATKLYKIYLDWVHPSFPIIGTAAFGAQFQAFFTTASLRPGNRWLAILNLIFAIAAKYAYLSETEWQTDKEAHLVYFLKAKALGLDNQLMTFPDLQQLQVEGLTSLYMLTLGHVNRAWTFCGSAIRGALGLGLHLRNVGDSTSDASREIRYRVWWTLYTLDLRLSIMSGRPSFINDCLCTSPLPVPFDEQDFGKDEVIRHLRRSIYGSPLPPTETTSAAQPETSAKSTGIEKRDTNEDNYSPCGSSYFLHLVQLTMIAKESLAKLYNPSALQSPWQSTELVVRSLMLNLDAWLINLPKEYDFTVTQSSHVSQATSNQRLSLALLFYSTRMGITRPCLRRVNLPNQEDKKMQEFGQKVAEECVESACHMLRLFPEDIKAATLYTASPWWCLLHFLMQATAVLALELAFQAQHVPDKAPMLSKALDKAYDWLSLMSRTQKAPERARRLCDRLLLHLKSKEGIKASESPSVQPTSLESPADTPISFPIKTTESVSDPSGPTGMKLDCQPSAALLTDGLTYAPSHLLESTGDLPMQSENTLGIPSNYEDLFPYDTSTGQLTGSLFPADYGLDVEPSEFYQF
ncbi:CeGAL family transcription factor [Aspergillus homomorphus CBS 101889]|uniref:Fungal-specific transcription factor n=1 Tax=Aspergillus homomorphus (strain CBS 101889) TaxID=1450537 RepID=A0A395I9C6_ASPHC|nr:fungal-specific transcription factor [Aspergillus homomorphus CBS 101889]RAL16870.1 fungal-specific transcription factor [Aspergillus homomorphus CBS 101889]